MPLLCRKICQTVSRYLIERDKYFYDSAWIVEVDYDNEAFEDAQDEDYEDQQASDDESNDEILGEDYDEMASDELYEEQQFELNNIQDDDTEPEGNNEITLK
jgi:hypothetical protein